jgi:hypothetical protein
MKTRALITSNVLAVALLSVAPALARSGGIDRGTGEPLIVAQVEYPSSRQRELEQPSYRQQQLEGVQEPPPPRYGQPASDYNQEVYEENLERRGITTQRLRGTRYYR